MNTREAGFGSIVRMIHRTFSAVALLFLAVCASAQTQGISPTPAEPPETVLVAGATGSIGKHVVQLLLARGHHVRGLTRKPDEARQDLPAVDWVRGDLRERESLADALRGVDKIVFAAGSRSWEDPTNTPEKIDFGGVAALAELGHSAGVKHMVLISSAGVTREWPNASAHLKNVLKWKAAGEASLRKSGVPYTILRPLGMWDEPGGQIGIALLQGDAVQASVTISRIDLAAVAVESLFHPDARNKTFELFNAATFSIDSWKKDLAKLHADP